MVSMQIISRIVLKIFQFICSTFVVYCLYNTGPQWMLTLPCLLVPPFSMLLLAYLYLYSFFLYGRVKCYIAMYTGTKMKIGPAVSVKSERNVANF